MKTAGYTLIEILVTLTIISVIFTSGYIAFRDFSRRQAADSVVRSLSGDLRLAQASAFAGKKPSGCTTSLTGYNFNLTSPTSYQLTAVCSVSPIVVKSVTFPPGTTIAFTNSSPTNPILFKVLGQGTNLVTNQTLTITAFGSTRNLTVSPEGTIE